MAKTSSYWDKRALDRLSSAERTSEVYIKRIKKMYDQAYRNINRDIKNVYKNYAKDTGIDVEKLKELLSKKETDKVWKTLKRQGLDKYIKNNYKARISRLEQIQAQIYAKAKLIYPKEELEHRMAYKGVINDSYYKTLYDMQMGTGLDFTFSRIDKHLLESILSEKWSGKNYSERIWGNTDILAESLSEVLGGGLTSGQSMQKTARQIRERFNVSKYYAERLVRTETNHFNNMADAMAYEEMGVEKYVFVATLDDRTSQKCQEMDNKKFLYKDKEEGVNFPPLHPNCRSKTRGYVDEETERRLKRRARNPQTNKVETIDNISYKEWAEKNGLVSKQAKLTNELKINSKNDIIKHNIANGKNIVGKFDLTKAEIYEDGGINRIMELQGYKGVPRVVDDIDFEKYVKESNFFAQRNYSGKTKSEVLEYQKQLYEGEWYIDCSVGGAQYGKGMYTAGVYDLNDKKGIDGIIEEMEHYRKLGKERKNIYSITEDFTIDKSARIIDYNDVMSRYIKEKSILDNWSNNEITLFDNYQNIVEKFNVSYQKYIANMYSGQPAQNYIDDYFKYKKEAENLNSQFTEKMKTTYDSTRHKDISTLAIELGYDIINAKGHGKSGSYTIILNRTKLIIRKGGRYYE